MEIVKISSIFHVPIAMISLPTLRNEPAVFTSAGEENRDDWHCFTNFMDSCEQGNNSKEEEKCEKNEKAEIEKSH